MNEPTGTISSRRLYDGHVIALDEEVVRYPDGTSGTLAIVRHPGASAVVPFLSDPHGADPTILMIRQYRHAAKGYLLEVPAGRLDTGESPVACAHRELREETGCTAGVMEHLTTVMTTPGFSDEQIHLFMATDLSPGASQKELDEFIEPIPLLLSDALRRIEQGEIRDAKTIVTLLFAAGYRTGASGIRG